jgi:hypothetical protein
MDELSWHADSWRCRTSKFNGHVFWVWGMKGWAARISARPSPGQPLIWQDLGEFPTEEKAKQAVKDAIAGRK